MRRLFYSIGFLIMLVLGLTFAARNPGNVSIHYYFGVDMELPLIVVVFASLVFGLILGWLIAVFGRYRVFRRRERALKNKGPAADAVRPEVHSTNALIERAS